jgi:hypothetical protein
MNWPVEIKDSRIHRRGLEYMEFMKSEYGIKHPKSRITHKVKVQNNPQS